MANSASSDSGLNANKDILSSHAGPCTTLNSTLSLVGNGHHERSDGAHCCQPQLDVLLNSNEALCGAHGGNGTSVSSAAASSNDAAADAISNTQTVSCNGRHRLHLCNGAAQWQQVDESLVNVKIVHSFTAHFNAKPFANDLHTVHGSGIGLHGSCDGSANGHWQFANSIWRVKPSTCAHVTGGAGLLGDQHVLPPAKLAEVVPSSSATSNMAGKAAMALCESRALLAGTAAKAPTTALQLQAPPLGAWELDPLKVVVGRRIAVGGFAEVFMASYEGTAVAVKRFIMEAGVAPEVFMAEIRLLASLRHPNLLLFIGYLPLPQLCMVSELMVRGSLFQLIQQRSAASVPIESKLARSVAASVARGMSYLHTRSPPVLHLDLKSSNILIDNRWRIKIGDFGLSRVRNNTYVSSSNATGTPEWMAPEVLRCERFDERADVYSYGVVLWELLTGRPPWQELNSMQVVGAVGFAGRSLSIPSQGDPFLVQLCSACMSTNPQHRPSFPAIVKAIDCEYGPQYGPTQHSTVAAAGSDLGAVAVPAVLALPPVPGPADSDAQLIKLQPAVCANAPSHGTDLVAATTTPVASPIRVAQYNQRQRFANHCATEGTCQQGGMLVSPFAMFASPSASTHADVLPLQSADQLPVAQARIAGSSWPLDSAGSMGRRRDRSPTPGGHEVHEPPAVTAKLGDGRKTPSPRVVAVQLWAARLAAASSAMSMDALLAGHAGWLPHTHRHSDLGGGRAASVRHHRRSRSQDGLSAEQMEAAAVAAAAAGASPTPMQLPSREDAMRHLQGLCDDTSEATDETTSTSQSISSGVPPCHVTLANASSSQASPPVTLHSSSPPALLRRLAELLPKDRPGHRRVNSDDVRLLRLARLRESSSGSLGPRLQEASSRSSSRHVQEAGSADLDACPQQDHSGSLGSQLREASSGSLGAHRVPRQRAMSGTATPATPRAMAEAGSPGSSSGMCHAHSTRSSLQLSVASLASPFASAATNSPCSADGNDTFKVFAGGGDAAAWGRDSSLSQLALREGSVGADFKHATSELSFADALTSASRLWATAHGSGSETDTATPSARHSADGASVQNASTQPPTELHRHNSADMVDCGVASSSVDPDAWDFELRPSLPATGDVGHAATSNDTCTPMAPALAELGAQQVLLSPFATAAPTVDVFPVMVAGGVGVNGNPAAPLLTSAQKSLGQPTSPVDPFKVASLAARAARGSSGGGGSGWGSAPRDSGWSDASGPSLSSGGEGMAVDDAGILLLLPTSPPVVVSGSTPWQGPAVRPVLTRLDVQERSLQSGASTPVDTRGDACSHGTSASYCFDCMSIGGRASDAGSTMGAPASDVDDAHAHASSVSEALETAMPMGNGTELTASVMCAHNRKSYRRGRFKVTAFEVVPGLTAQAIVMPGAAGAVASAAAAATAAQTTAGEGSDGAEVAVPRSFKMYRKGRFFVSSFHTQPSTPTGSMSLAQDGPSGEEPLLLESMSMPSLPTASSTTATTAALRSLAGSAGPPLSGAAGFALGTIAGSTDLLNSVSHHLVEPQQGSQQPQHSSPHPACAVRLTTPAGRQSPQLPAPQLRGSISAEHSQVVVETRHYHRGRFDVTESVPLAHTVTATSSAGQVLECLAGGLMYGGTSSNSSAQLQLPMFLSGPIPTSVLASAVLGESRSSALRPSAGELLAAAAPNAALPLNLPLQLGSPSDSSAGADAAADCEVAMVTRKVGRFTVHQESRAMSRGPSMGSVPQSPASMQPFASAGSFSTCTQAAVEHSRSCSPTRGSRGSSVGPDSGVGYGSRKLSNNDFGQVSVPMSRRGSATGSAVTLAALEVMAATLAAAAAEAEAAEMAAEMPQVQHLLPVHTRRRLSHGGGGLGGGSSSVLPAPSLEPVLEAAPFLRRTSSLQRPADEPHRSTCCTPTRAHAAGMCVHVPMPLQSSSSDLVSPQHLEGSSTPRDLGLLSPNLELGTGKKYTKVKKAGRFKVFEESDEPFAISPRSRDGRAATAAAQLEQAAGPAAPASHAMELPMALRAATVVRAGPTCAVEGRPPAADPASAIALGQPPVTVMTPDAVLVVSSGQDTEGTLSVLLPQPQLVEIVSTAQHAAQNVAAGSAVGVAPIPVAAVWPLQASAGGVACVATQAAQLSTGRSGLANGQAAGGQPCHPMCSSDMASHSWDHSCLPGLGASALSTQCVPAHGSICSAIVKNQVGDGGDVEMVDAQLLGNVHHEWEHRHDTMQGAACSIGALAAAAVCAQSPGYGWDQEEEDVEMAEA